MQYSEWLSVKYWWTPNFSFFKTGALTKMIKDKIHVSDQCPSMLVIYKSSRQFVFYNDGMVFLSCEQLFILMFLICYKQMLMLTFLTCWADVDAHILNLMWADVYAHNLNLLWADVYAQILSLLEPMLMHIS